MRRVSDKGNIFIDDTPGIEVADLKKKCIQYMSQEDKPLIIVDYLQLISCTEHGNSRQEEVSNIMRELKNIARELDVPILLLSQLSRDPENREDHRPVLSDLRESNAIEDESDIVMFLYRDNYYNADADRNEAEIIVAKNRLGEKGTCEIRFIPELIKFTDLSSV